MEQAITESGAISANWGFLALAALANILLYRLLARIERKLEEHDSKFEENDDRFNEVAIVTGNHELRIQTTEKAIDKWSEANTKLADQIITKIRAAGGI